MRLERDAGLLVGVEDLGELLDRREELVEVEQEGDEHARRERVVGDQHGADAQHDDRRHLGEELDEREVERHQLLGVEAGLEVVVADPSKRRWLTGSRAKAWVTRTPDRLSWRLAFTIAMRSRAGRRPGLERARNHTVATISGGRTVIVARASVVFITSRTMPTPMNVASATRAVTSPVWKQLGQRVDVAGHAGHDPAGQLALVVVEAEPLELGEDPEPQAEQQALGGAPGHERLGHQHHPVGQRHHAGRRRPRPAARRRPRG